MHKYSRSNLFLTIIWCVLLTTGCSGLGSHTVSATNNSRANSNAEIAWRYGNFCGKGHPYVSPNLSKSEQIVRLLSETPIDDIDLSCQLHDICYSASGVPTYICDRVLAENLANLRPLFHRNNSDRSGLFKDSSGKILDGCEKLTSEVEMFAYAASGFNREIRSGWDLLEMAVMGYGTALMTIVNTPGMLIGGLFSKQGAALAAGVGGVSCIASREPKLIAPYSTLEIDALKNCFSVESKFRRCRSVPTQGRLPRVM